MKRSAGVGTVMWPISIKRKEPDTRAGTKLATERQSTRREKKDVHSTQCKWDSDDREDVEAVARLKARRSFHIPERPEWRATRVSNDSRDGGIELKTEISFVNAFGMHTVSESSGVENVAVLGFLERVGMLLLTQSRGPVAWKYLGAPHLPRCFAAGFDSVLAPFWRQGDARDEARPLRFLIYIRALAFAAEQGRPRKTPRLRGPSRSPPTLHLASVLTALDLTHPQILSEPRTSAKRLVSRARSIPRLSLLEYIPLSNTIHHTLPPRVDRRAPESGLPVHLLGPASDREEVKWRSGGRETKMREPADYP
ncbi:hypothetical protein C8R45DRAFT_1131991 [Mycena sanguinolenta]|nr:hypothetical protein C8R45DRAFT_1131991 [Mycena sanguinolenta]